MNQITLTHILGALLRHKLRVLLVFSLIMILSVVLFVIWPRQFGSEGRLYVQLGRNNSGLDPTPGVKSISIQDSRETEIRSVAEIAKSRIVLEQVVDEIGAERILAAPSLMKFIALPDIAGFFKSETDSAEVSEDGLSREEFVRLRTREKAAKAIQDSMIVNIEKKTSVISIYARASSARLAQQIVDALMRYTREKHLEVHSLGGSTRFFDEEFEKHQKLVNKAIDAQAEFRNKLGVLSVDGARATLQQIISRLENDLLSAEVSLAEASERVAKYELELKNILPKIAVPTQGIESQSYENSLSELTRLKTQRARLLATRSEENPEVIRVTQAIKVAEADLKNLQSDRTQSELKTNPVYEQIETSLVRARVDRDAISSRLKNTRTKLTEAKVKLESLNGSQRTAAQFQRDIDIAKQYLATYATKRGEVQVLDELDRQRISDVVVAQDASFMVKHVSPKGSLIILLGAFAGMLLSFAVAVYLDRNNLSGSVGEDEVEQILDMPVLVTLPRVYSNRNMVN